MSEPCLDDASDRDQHPAASLRRETDVAQSSVSSVLVPPPADGEFPSSRSRHRPNLHPPEENRALARPSSPTGDALPRFTDRTLEVWQPRSARPLSREDARQISENIYGFFRTLLEWENTEIRCAPSTTFTVKHAGTGS